MAQEVDDPNSQPNWVMSAFGDWLSFMQGPTSPPFSKDCVECDWSRLFRLMALVIFLLNAVVGTFAVAAADFNKLVLGNRNALLILLGGMLASVVYAFIISPVFKVKISLPQAFFAFLQLGVPWLPLIALVWAIGYTQQPFPLKGFLVPINLYLIPLLTIKNIRRGVSVITDCPAWRVRASLFIPLILYYTLSIYMIW
jgi:hypothetical protein